MSYISCSSPEAHVTCSCVNIRIIDSCSHGKDRKCRCVSISEQCERHYCEVPRQEWPKTLKISWISLYFSCDSWYNKYGVFQYPRHSLISNINIIEPFTHVTSPIISAKHTLFHTLYSQSYKSLLAASCRSTHVCMKLPLITCFCLYL